MPLPVALPYKATVAPAVIDAINVPDVLKPVEFADLPDRFKLPFVAVMLSVPLERPLLFVEMPAILKVPAPVILTVPPRSAPTPVPVAVPLIFMIAPEAALPLIMFEALDELNAVVLAVLPIILRTPL